MKKNGRVAAIILLVIIGALLLAGAQGCKRTKIVREGDAAPDFTLPGLDGRTVTLSSLKGKVVLVHFWATWCPPCVEEFPLLEQFHRAMSGRDVVVLAVSVDEGGPEVVRAFLQKNRLSLPVLLNPDRTVAGGYGSFKFPETYVLDRNGIVRYKVIGTMNWADPAVIRRIGEML